MPRIGETKRNDLAVEAMFIGWEQLADWAKWRKNYRGSFVRPWEGLTLTIFRRGGYWRWCIAGSDEPRYSSGLYEWKEEALDSLCGELIF